MTQLSAEARKLVNEYYRNWKKRNPDKAKQYRIDYWERKAANCSIVDKAKRLSEQGMTQREIAKKLNLSIGTVNRCLKKQ